MATRVWQRHPREEAGGSGAATPETNPRQGAWGPGFVVCRTAKGDGGIWSKSLSGGLGSSFVTPRGGPESDLLERRREGRRERGGGAGFDF
ncbi:hypothetical protein TIFTF001_028024 [Ficus carica]|uniref:Uncharacterized protein n=1 Tax=Ficus carica TaxID=3494 RepID=A0AA88DP65_FICCA|nr:hypothetical protein TIFTF001_028024 [Ficus carica]